ncbi:carbamoyl-phosphate synthase large subunit [bacterium]|nr:carbamoyl-phosphate synthase large subunit [bacterium]
MSKRTDIKKILIIGSGPIVIGQACEFDYSGTQACKALKAEGYEIVLVNSNPATIMTDPEMADRTYIEPITPEIMEKIIEKERPDAVLPTLGGQTGLNTAVETHKLGVFDKYNVEMIGLNIEAIHRGEDREKFKQVILGLGLDLPKSGLGRSMEESVKAAEEIGYPVIIRPAFTLGGTGGGVADNETEFRKIAALGLENSLIHEILVEESVTGWKEYELEVMRDKADNVVIICSIENLDPMGVHTGDSITVAPAQTLSDKEYQKMRDAGIAIIRAIGVETGGSNIQFAVNPEDGRLVVIEMNPRVSRSSALASKATGFPIAKIAALLAVGYTLDEIPNDITQKTMACFEPTIDYCVVKIPRFAFEKFPGADPKLGVSMKSVGETMAIGRTFREAFQKGLRGLEIHRSGYEHYPKIGTDLTKDILKERLAKPHAERMFTLREALRQGMAIEEIYAVTGIDPWFLHQLAMLVERDLKEAKAGHTLESISAEWMREIKQEGFSDQQISGWLNCTELEARAKRKALGVLPTYKLVDTCGAEFESYTPYCYSTYETENEMAVPSDKKKIMILGSGPNRIGQGIEFDYCCCHASFAMEELGYETIMVNSNPETVSTDYDTSDKLYFEPLTFEDIMNIIDQEKPAGVIVQFGGQTPLNLARRLEDAGAPIMGTPVEAIERAEDRDQFAKLMVELDMAQPENGIARSVDEVLEHANTIGFPVLVRPSFVLGGRAMRIVYDPKSLMDFVQEAFDVAEGQPVLIDKFLEDAIEVDVDGVCDGETTVVAGIMEHIEEAGIHSGDSACVLPPHTLSEEVIERIKIYTDRIAMALGVRGLLNIQFAIRRGNIYVLEVNPRASRTVPFVSKATGQPWAKIASKVMAGKSLQEQGIAGPIQRPNFCIKESVLPFSRFAGVDIYLGPEMKSTGEVMGVDASFGMAFIKSQMGAGQKLPSGGTVFISVKDDDKRDIVFLARQLQELGFEIVSTPGTTKVLKSNNIPVSTVEKIGHGSHSILDLIKDGKIQLIINTPFGPVGREHVRPIGTLAVGHGIPCITTLQGAQAAVNGLRVHRDVPLTVSPLQEWYGKAQSALPEQQ